METSAVCWPSSKSDFIAAFPILNKSIPFGWLIKLYTMEILQLILQSHLCCCYDYYFMLHWS